MFDKETADCCLCILDWKVNKEYLQRDGGNSEQYQCGGGRR